TLILVGAYTATWPDVELVLKTVDPQAGKLLHTVNLAGSLDDLVALEADAAQALAKELGAEQPDVTPGAFGTKNIRAWRGVALGQEIIMWQSLSPPSADPNAPLALPKDAI